MALDLSSDYLAVDFPEAVTLTSTANSGDSTLAVTHAFARQLTTKELQASSGVVARSSNAYDIPMTLITGYSWKPGDTITDSEGNILVIYQASKDPTTAFWSFLVFNPKIAFDLRHTIEVYELQMDKDASSAPIMADRTLLYSDISCRVQWQIESGGVFQDREGDRKEAVIHSSQRLYLTHNCVIEWTDPETEQFHTFDVRDWKNSDRLDELQAIRVEIKP